MPDNTAAAPENAQPQASEGDLSRIFSQALSEFNSEGMQTSEPTESVEEEVVEDVAGQQEPEEVQDPVLQAAAEAGFDIDDYEDAQSFLQDLAKYREQADEYRPLAEYAKQILPYRDQVEAALSGQKQQEPEEKQPDTEQTLSDYFKEKWSIPEYESAWDRFLGAGMLELDENTGKYIPAKDFTAVVPASVVDGINKYQDARRDALERLVNNPFEATWDALQKPIQDMIEQAVQQKTAQDTTVTEFTKWEEENKEILFSEDGKDFSEYGLKLIDKAKELKTKFGESADDLMVIRLAQEIIPKPDTKLTEEPKEEEKAVETPKQASDKKKKTFLEDAIEKAGHKANSGGYAESNEQVPVFQNSRELETYFSSQAKKQGM
jgi:hypothetical protein